MIRGKTLFICTKCKKIFWAPDVEYGATVYSMPMPCKRCGSIRTMPLLMPLIGFIREFGSRWRRNNFLSCQIRIYRNSDRYRRICLSASGRWDIYCADWLLETLKTVGYCNKHQIGSFVWRPTKGFLYQSGGVFDTIC